MTRTLLIVVAVLLLAIFLGIDVRSGFLHLLAAVGTIAADQVQDKVVSAPVSPDVRWTILGWCVAILFAAIPIILVFAAIAIVLHKFIVPAVNNLRYARDDSWQRAKLVDAWSRRPRGLTNAEVAMVAGVHDAKRAKAEAEAEAARIRAEHQRRRLEQAYQAPPALRQLESPVQPLVPTYTTVDFRAAMAESRGWSYQKAEIVIGQAGPHMDSDAGALATLDLTVNPFVMISGKPNSGKTKGAAFTFVAGVLQWGWPVVVFEPGNKRDWKKIFGEHVIHHTLNADNCMRHLEMLEAEYNRRAQLLQQHGYIEWNESEASARLCPPLLIVMEELGTTLKRIALRLDGEKKGHARDRTDAFTSKLSILVLEARASGMFMLAIQQRPVDYPSDLLSSFTHIAYKLGGIGQGTAVGSPRNHLLAEQGEFDMGVASRTRTKDGSPLPILFQSFDTKHDIARFLMRVRIPPKPLPLLPNGCCESIWLPVSVPMATDAQPRTPAPPAPPKPQPLPSQALIDAGVIYVTERKWDAFAQAWCADNRTGVTPADLARAMADFHNEHFPADFKDWKINFYSQARRLFARYHVQGEPERVAGVIEQIARDEAKDAQVKVAQSAGATVTRLRKADLQRPTFM